MAHFLPKAAIFDLDGTLTDSMYVWDRLPEELVRQFGGIPAPDLSHTLRAMSSPQAIDYLIRTYHLPATPQQLTQAMEAIADREYRENVPLKPGVCPLLERLHQLGIPCCVATASQVHQARQALERLGVWSFFSFALSATQYGPWAYSIVANLSGHGTEGLLTIIFVSVLPVRRLEKSIKAGVPQ